MSVIPQLTAQLQMLQYLTFFPLRMSRRAHEYQKSPGNLLLSKGLHFLISSAFSVPLRFGSFSRSRMNSCENSRTSNDFSASAFLRTIFRRNNDITPWIVLNRPIPIKGEEPTDRDGPGRGVTLNIIANTRHSFNCPFSCQGASEPEVKLPVRAESHSATGDDGEYLLTGILGIRAVPYWNCGQEDDSVAFTVVEFHLFGERH